MQDEQISVRSLLRLFFSYKWLALFIFILTCVAGSFLYTIQPKRYKTFSLLISDAQPQQNASFQSLALMAGIGLSSTNSNTVYLKDYVNTSEFLSHISKKRWIAPIISKDSVHLVDLWVETNKIFVVPESSDTDKINRDVISYLLEGKYITFSQEKTTGLFKMTCDFEDPQVSYDVCLYSISLLNDWNSNKRRSAAKDTRAFLEERLELGKKRLEITENAQRKFREANLVNNSPYIQLQEGRLTRDIQIAQEIYLQLVKQYEMALTDEVKESSALDIMQSPLLVTLPTSPNVKQWIVIVIMAAGVSAFIFVLIADFMIIIYKEIKKAKSK